MASLTDTYHVAVAGLIVGLLTYRLARLVAVDTIFNTPRAKTVAFFAKRGVVGRWFVDLIICPICWGVWISGALTLVVLVVYGLPAPVVVWGAAAGLSCWMATLER